MLVVKLGGSLLEGGALPGWLQVLSDDGGGRAVVVPGGGPFAESVRAAQRAWPFSDAAAHRMALLAMEQFAALLCDRVPLMRPAPDMPAIDAALAAGRLPVWLPCAMLVHGAPGVAETWQVTSDSLAAWLAGRLKATRLVLIKSAAPPHDGLAQLAQSGYVDAAFPAFAAACGAALTLLGPGQQPALRALLRQAPQRSPGSQG